MAHYAFLDENNIVVEVITGKDEDDTTNGILDWEEYYGNLRGMKCKRTSYNSYGGVNKRTMEEGFRKNFAGVGFSYVDEIDAFIPPRQYGSWLLDEESCLWVPPIPAPDDFNHYEWDEFGQRWVFIHSH